ncbi:MAG: carbohydrate binding family 9 domain-containing protein, partial [Vicinamibacterales bacterium]
MRRPCVLLLLLTALLPSVVSAQERDRKRAQASRVPDGAIRVDGRLDEEAWRLATPVTDFVQKEPDEGQPATDAIDVRFVFDDSALYVGARMVSASSIQAPLGRRDEGDQAEHLIVSLDTYLDRRTSYSFGVTASGVRIDFFHDSDDEFSDDETFNPVWQARTVVEDGGWTAELWIPLSQLRFNERTPQVWGLNVKRWVPTKNEELYWSPIRRTDDRWASLFGELHGLDGIEPRRRIELLPYVAGDSRRSTAEAGDPFGGSTGTGRVGAD